MLELSTTVLEIPTSKTSELGVNWAEQTVGGFYAGVAGDYHVDSEITARPGESPVTLTFPTAGTNVVAGVNALLSSTISLLVQKGDAVILANPRLTTRSGSAAEFLSGGEIPYVAASATGTPSVQFKPYGVKLSISPVADARTGTIRSVIDTEISDIDPSLSTSAGPALLTRRTRVEFNVREGETMVLSGFRQRRRSEDIAQLPLLGDIPVLGSLFRSRSFADRETTLVIFVTPRTVAPGSTSVVEQIRDAQRRIRELDEPEPKPVAPAGRFGPRS
jgi:Flp pilus assembly secretin CpaC